MNFIVAVSPLYELMEGDPPNAQLKPSTVGLMLRDGTALVWDTSVGAPPSIREGFLVGADIDGQRFWRGAEYPRFRYFDPNDPFGQIPPGIFGNNKPVGLNVGGATFHNIDPPSGTLYPYQGNLRFRHQNENACFAGFSDGSVRQFTAKVRSDLTVSTHDALRKYFMTEWPPGVDPNPDPEPRHHENDGPPVRDPGR